MNKAIFGLYSDYLRSSFGQVTATGLSSLLEGDLSHDQLTRTLAGEKLTSKAWWRLVEAFVRQIERPDRVMLIDDTIVEKPLPTRTRSSAGILTTPRVAMSKGSTC